MRNHRRLCAVILLVGIACGCGLRRGRTYHADPFTPTTPTAQSNTARTPQSNLLGDAPAADPEFASTETPDSATEDAVQQAALPATNNRSVVTADWEGEGKPQEPVIPAEGTRVHHSAPPMSQPTGQTGPAHAPDYSWVQGHLEYSGLNGGMWKVRYASLAEDDPHGGSVILDTDPTDQGYQAGELIWVQGQLAPNVQRKSLPNPLYHVQQIRPVD